MSDENLKELLKELVAVDKEIVNRINELKSMMAQDNKVKQYVC